MEPKRNIKKHRITKPYPWVISHDELVRRINETASYIHNNTLNGPANWVIMSSDGMTRFNESLGNYTNDLPNVEVDDLTITVTGDTWFDV